MISKVLILIVCSLAFFDSCYGVTWNSKKGCPKYSGFVFQDTAHNSHGLKNIVNKFRKALGGIDNGNEPGQKDGHRSINWDADVVPFDMPGDFFKNQVTRGAEFFAAKGKFAVSNPPANDPSGIKDNRFSSFNRNFPHIFTTFSPKRLFTPVKNNAVLTLFSVPASKKGEKALVSGFGAIFTNVVLKRRTLILFYDKNNCLITTLPIAPKPKGLSFGGIIVTHKNGKKVDTSIAKVKIILGTGVISKPFGKANFVVLDDLIYGEPIGLGKSSGY